MRFFRTRDLRLRFIIIELFKLLSFSDMIEAESSSVFRYVSIVSKSRERPESGGMKSKIDFLSDVGV